MIRLFLSVATVAITASSFSQSFGIDRKKKSIFNYYSVGSNLFSLSADGDISYAFTLKLDTAAFVLTDRSRKQILTDSVTAVKLYGWPLELKLITNLTFVSSDKLKSFRPGFQIKFGRQVAIRNIYDSIVPTKAVASGGVNLLFKMDNFSYFDTVTKMAPTYQLPITYGVELHHNLIFTNNKRAVVSENDKTKSYKSRYILSGTATITNTWNEDDMISFQELSKVIINPPVAAFENAAGKYGVLQERKWNARLSLSAPMYFWASKFWWRINPIPYVVFSSFEGKKPVYYAGAFINILNERKDASTFSVPSSLGFGIDWKFTSEQTFLKTPVIFLKGTFAFERKRNK